MRKKKRDRQWRHFTTVYQIFSSTCTRMKSWFRVDSMVQLYEMIREKWIYNFEKRGCDFTLQKKFWNLEACKPIQNLNNHLLTIKFRDNKQSDGQHKIDFLRQPFVVFYNVRVIYGHRSTNLNRNDTCSCSNLCLDFGCSSPQRFRTNSYRRRNFPKSRGRDFGLPRAISSNWSVSETKRESTKSNTFQRIHILLDARTLKGFVDFNEIKNNNLSPDNVGQLVCAICTRRDNSLKPAHPSHSITTRPP